MKRDPSITCRHVDPDTFDLNGVRGAVIGGAGGIGCSLSRSLAKQGCSVLVVGQTFRDDGVKNISFMKADLRPIEDAKRVAQDLPAEQRDLVVMTMGIMAGPRREVTTGGIERDLAISYLSRLSS
jgi:NAD(P)-dependent dehydrogenase (short-subunit alcohol dehydrogenase family)